MATVRGGILLTFLLSLAVAIAQVIQLETYNIEPGSITVSGISGGGAMTGQMHVIYSGTFSGAGYFAGRVSVVIEDFYDYFGSQSFPVFGHPAEHTQPTDDFGNLCNVTETPYISDCKYDGAYTMLKTLYGSINPPATEINPSSIFADFDQEEFFAVSNPVLETSGYIFIPAACQDKLTPCKLHMVFHGCLMGKEYIGDVYAKHTGYIETAESNNIIVIFPQAASQTLGNPQGCFDWWGYTNRDYANNEGDQPRTLIAMVDRLAGISRSK